jgi:hypothetical protein
VVGGTLIAKAGNAVERMRHHYVEEQIDEMAN